GHSHIVVTNPMMLFYHATYISSTFHIMYNYNPPLTPHSSPTRRSSDLEADPNATNNSATEPTAVATSGDLSITKTDSPDPVQTRSEAHTSKLLSRTDLACRLPLDEESDPIPSGTSGSQSGTDSPIASGI